MSEMKQPFEKYEPLSSILQTAANHWKVDGSNWNALLYEINELCLKIEELEAISKATGDKGQVMARSKITNKIAKEFAIIHSSEHLSYIDSSALDGLPYTEDEKQKLISAVHALADRLSNGRPMNLGGSEQILNYLLKPKGESNQ